MSAKDVILNRYGWTKITAPQIWRPKAPGEALVGYYGGRTVRDGQFGQYDVAIIHVPYDYRGTYLVSGAELIQLLDAAMIDKGHPVHVIYMGREKTAKDREMKRFELRVADGEPVAESDLPKVSQ